MSRRIATIGFFDGVHLGHRFLIKQIQDMAAKHEAESLIVTMYPHPRAIVQPGFQPQLLTTLDEKLNLLQKTGIHKVEVLQFDKEMSRMSAQDFMEQVLHEKLGIDRLVMGYDHRFGHDKVSHEEMMAIAEEIGIKIIKVGKGTGYRSVADGSFFGRIRQQQCHPQTSASRQRGKSRQTAWQTLCAERKGG